jgi:hypothetical protein
MINKTLTRQVLFEKTETKYVMIVSRLALPHYDIFGAITQVRDLKHTDKYKDHLQIDCPYQISKEFASKLYIITEGKYKGLCILKKRCQFLSNG